MADLTFTDSELDYLRGQRLARLATVDQDGAPQNNPVGFFLDEATGRVMVGGHRFGQSRKFRNVLRNPQVALVVDDLASVDPWRPRCVEIRGTAEALTDVDPPLPGFSREAIVITPTWIGSIGIDPAAQWMAVRRAS